MKRCLLFLAVCWSHSLFGFDVLQYHNNSSIQWTWGILSLENLPLQGNEWILDMGSGDGKLTAHLASCVPDGAVWGVEPNKEALAYAREHYASGHSNITFVEGSAEQFTVNQKFDCLFANCTYNWVEDKEKAFQKIHEILRPGGYGLIVVPTGTAEDTPLRMKMMKLFNSQKWSPYLKSSPQKPCSPEKYKTFIEEAGFEIEILRKVKTSVVFSNKDEVGNWLIAVREDFKSMPSPLLSEFLDEYVAITQEHFPQADDGRIYCFPCKLEILFQKLPSKKT